MAIDQHDIFITMTISVLKSVFYYSNIFLGFLFFFLPVFGCLVIIKQEEVTMCHCLNEEVKMLQCYNSFLEKLGVVVTS